MIPEDYKANFATLLRAAQAGRLALLDCTDSQTGEPRYVIVAVSDTTDGSGDFDFVPFGHLSNGNPYEEYNPPV